jgi:hypothetical protein
MCFVTYIIRNLFLITLESRRRLRLHSRCHSRKSGNPCFLAGSLPENGNPRFRGDDAVPYAPLTGL